WHRPGPPPRRRPARLRPGPGACTPPRRWADRDRRAAGRSGSATYLGRVVYQRVAGIIEGVADVDLSFPRYVAARKGAASARAREGAHYAYAADLRIRSALDKVRPVSLSVEATLRFWQSVGKNRFLGSAVRVGERQFPKIHALVQRCAEVLQIPAPTVYVAPNILTLTARTLGTADDAMIALG